MELKRKVLEEPSWGAPSWSKEVLSSFSLLFGEGGGAHFLFTGNLVGFSFHSFVPKRIEWIIWTLNKQSNNKFLVQKK